MSASHNPGGPEEDWGIKFNYSSGQPAPEYITDNIYQFTTSLSELKIADIPDVDLSKPGNHKFGSFEARSSCSFLYAFEHYRDHHHHHHHRHRHHHQHCLHCHYHHHRHYHHHSHPHLYLFYVIRA